MSNSKKMTLLEIGIGKIAVLKKTSIASYGTEFMFFNKAILLPTTAFLK